MTSRSGSVHELTILLSALRRARRPSGAHAAQLHARLLVYAGARPHPVLLTQLVSLYAAAGRLADALRAFRAHLPSANLRTYTALVSALARPHPGIAFSLFSSCARRGSRLIPHAISAVLAACAGLPPVYGRQVHACAAKVVPPGDMFVYTGLVDVYSKAGDMAASRKVFDEMPSRGVASWNALVVGYARNKMCLDALLVFRELGAQGREVPLDQVSVSSVLSACTGAGAVDFGRQVHACVTKVGLELSAVCVSNALLDMYTRCGCSREALVLLDDVECRDVVTWNIVIHGCIHNNRFKEASMLFRSMVRDGVLPDDVSFATALQASASLSAWALGASIHASVVKTGFLDSHGLACSLVTMYSKCGFLDDACRAFEGAEDHLCVTLWTAMITALQQHGHGVQAIDMFETMLENGIPPDHITFISVLSSCSHNGLVEQGRKYFNSMTQVHKITPWSEHYACMVNMFGRAGLLGEAKKLINQMRVKPDASLLGALLAACMNCRDLEMGKEVAKKLFEVEPGNTGNYVLLANIYASHGRLEDADEVRRWMMYQELRKMKGCSLVNNENQTCTIPMLH
ncbi:pentatricopeptide repeat-containing protein At1g08070, chloroplastic-like [Phragmites australis]|uniref:pentatricopeptide repeat-containing protein At1g08070, chloroplastic-like n=1 Tax=Phragmites australis TaxID=29695 RepID=UPI002D797001|nr:pentatricopeptide repeat-containing protein At1g08070, chloroplastic-like [Phragmites australis]